MYASDSQHPDLSLQDKLEKLFGFRGGPTADLTIRPDLYGLLGRLGDPHTALPPVFHVAGTNGKGSVLAVQQAILEAAGYSIHKYTSPHLQRFNERIVLNGRMIKDDQLETLLDEVMEAAEGLSLTFFEITTVMAFLAFSRTPADCVLLETGVGGRLDCTNVIETPLMTMITSIGLDHREFLGETLDLIAREKAGIMKRGTPCIIAPQDDTVMKTLYMHADSVNVDIQGYGDTWRIDEMGPKMRLQISSQKEHHDMILPRPALPGRHQVINAGVAISALLFQDTLPVDENSIVLGLQHVQWPARMQSLPASAFGLDADWSVYLDGGHNEQAGKAIAEQIQRWKDEVPERSVHLLLGMMSTKEPTEFIKPLVSNIESLTVIPISGEPAAYCVDELAVKAGKLFHHVHKASDLQAAFLCLRSYIKDKPGEKDPAAKHETAGNILIIAGSLYLAGRVLSYLDKAHHED